MNLHPEHQPTKEEYEAALNRQWFFTFGCNTENRNKYVRVIARDYENARRIMFDHYGAKWGFQYDEEQFKGQIEQFGLSELETLREIEI